MQITVRDAARLLRVPERTVHEWVRDRGLPHYKVQEQLRFNPVELLEWATVARVPLAPEAFEDPESGGGRPIVAAAMERGRFLHDVAAADKEDAVRQVVESVEAPREVDREFIAAALRPIRDGGTTGVGGGLAIPQARHPIVLPVPEAALHLCFLGKPVPFGAADGQPVGTIIVLVTPTVRAHLRILARLGLLLGDGPLRGLLERAAPREEVLRVTRAEEERLCARAGAGA
jgi:PTS system nitrogen regulatory IIA component